MTTDEEEVKAAAERLKRINAGVEKSQDIYGVTFNQDDRLEAHAACIRVKRLMLDDKRLLLDYAAALLSEEPVTEEICRSLGGTNKLSAYGMESDVFHFPIPHTGWFIQWGRNSKTLSIGEQEEFFGCTLAQNATTGQLLHLMAALGGG